jgi:hypothetical protein
MQQLARASSIMDAKLGTTAVIHPTISRPNRRASAAPDRPSYEVCGIYDEIERPMGGSKSPGADGLDETMISSMVSTLSVQRGACKFPPTQGDRVYIPHLGRWFAVLDVRFDMHTRTTLVLENLEAPPAA